MKTTIAREFIFLPKSKIKAGEGKEDGLYPFFTSSDIKVQRIDTMLYDTEAIILGTGGRPSCNYYAGQFSTSTDNFVLQSKGRVLPKYLYYFLRTDGLSILEKGFQGAGLKHIGKSYVSEIVFPMRGDKEQKRIVEELDAINALIALIRSQVSLLDEQVKSLFNDMFGGVKTNALWPSTLLGPHIKFMTSGSRGWAKYITPSGCRFITIKNVKNTKIFFDEETFVTPPPGQEGTRTKVQEGDVLISITADLGRTGVVTKEIAKEDAYINQHLAMVRIDRSVLEPLYVAHCLESEDCKEQFDIEGRGGTKLGLNFDQVRKLVISLPPLNIQRKFVDRLEEIDKLRFNYQQQIKLLNELLEAKMAEYFGGEE